MGIRIGSRHIGNTAGIDPVTVAIHPVFAGIESVGMNQYVGIVAIATTTGGGEITVPIEISVLIHPIVTIIVFSVADLHGGRVDLRIPLITVGPRENPACIG
jgi:hypothetical protein